MSTSKYEGICIMYMYVYFMLSPSIQFMESHTYMPVHRPTGQPIYFDRWKWNKRIEYASARISSLYSLFETLYEMHRK